MNQLDAAILFGDGEDGAVELAPGRLNDAVFQPFSHMSIHLLTISIQDFELFDIDLLLSLQGDYIQWGVFLSKVKLVSADNLMVFENSVQVVRTEG